MNNIMLWLSIIYAATVLILLVAVITDHINHIGHYVPGHYGETWYVIHDVLVACFWPWAIIWRLTK